MLEALRGCLKVKVLFSRFCSVLLFSALAKQSRFSHTAPKHYIYILCFLVLPLHRGLLLLPKWKIPPVSCDAWHFGKNLNYNVKQTLWFSTKAFCMTWMMDLIKVHGIEQTDSLKKREKNNFSLLCRRPCFIQRSSGRTDEFARLSCLSQWLCVWWSDHLQVCDCLMYCLFVFCHFPPSHTTLSLYIHLLTILPFAMLLSSFYGDSRDRQWWVGHGGLLLGNTSWE